MKVNTLFTIVIKIAGLVALWKFLMSLSGIVMALGLFSSVGNGFQGSGFMASIALSMLLTTGVTGALAFISLFCTDAIIRLLNIDGEQTIDVGENKAMIFKALVIIGAILLIVNGATDALSYDYKTDTNNNTNITNGVVQNNTNVTNSQTKRVNYFAFLELVLGALALLRGAAVSSWLMYRFKDDEPMPAQEWPDMYKQQV